MANIRQVGIFFLVWMLLLVLFAAFMATGAERAWLTSFANSAMLGFIIVRLVFYPANNRRRDD